MPLLVAGLCAMPACAQAAAPYVSASTGLGLLNNSSEDGFKNALSYNSGYFINGAAGLKASYARFEAEVGYHHNSIDTYFGNPVTTNARVSMWTFMVNGYLDYNIKDSDITPYLMAGMGLADVTFQNDFSSDSDTVFAWQLGAGLGIKASDKVTFDIGYRYLSPADVNVWGSTYSLNSSNILAGIRYNF